MRKVTIVDYGLGNLHSVSKSLIHVGVEVEIDTDGSRIPRAERLVLPGVGAFADGMAGLRARGQIAPLQQYGAENRSFLGICLGAQLLLEESDEFGCHPGLGIIPGRVERIAGEGVKVPHTGWAQVLPADDSASFPGLLRDLASGTWAYFIHSYQMVPRDPWQVTAVCRYGSQRITAVVQRGAICGMQFHPEKSGESGLTALKAFALS